MMQVIPIQAAPSQRVSVSLSGQSCAIEIAQKTTGVFVNLYVDDTLVIGGVIAENATAIVRSAYLGFYGDIAFLDTQPPPLGPTDPVYTGFGSRYILAYFLPSELPLLGTLVAAEQAPG